MASASQQEISEPIKCFLRLRPSSSNKTAPNVTNSTKLTIKNKQYTFDGIFDENCSQLNVYEKVVKPFLDDCFFGYTHSIITYGQNATGKTYSMFGYDKTLTNHQQDSMAGLVPLTLLNLFKRLQCMRFLEYLVRISFVEIYNEETYDLIVNRTNKNKTATYSLNETTVDSFEEFMKQFSKGLKYRQSDVKTEASLSHAILSVTLYSKNEKNGLLPVCKLNFVDLAGIPREQRNFSKSLTTLNRCIQALSDKKQHIPYRESKLTHLLQDSLGGTAKTSFLVTSFDDFGDCTATRVLEFAQKVREIVNVPKMLPNNTEKSTMLQLLHDQLEKYQNEISAARSRNGVYVNGVEHNGMMRNLERFQRAYLENNTIIKDLQVEVKQLEELVNNSRIKTNHLQEKQKILSNELNLYKEKYFQVNVCLSEERFVVETCLEQGKILNNFMKLLNTSNNRLKDEQIVLKSKINQQINANLKYNDGVENVLEIVARNCQHFRNDFVNNECEVVNVCNNISGYVNDAKSTVEVLKNCPQYEKLDGSLSCFHVDEFVKNCKIENDSFLNKWTGFMNAIGCEEFFQGMDYETKSLKQSMKKNFQTIENHWKTELMNQKQFNEKIQHIVNEFHSINKIQVKDCRTMQNCIQKSRQEKYNTKQFLDKIKIQLNEVIKNYEMNQKNHIKEYLNNYNTVIHTRMKNLLEKVQSKYEEIKQTEVKNKKTESEFMKLFLQHIENVFDQLNKDIDDRLEKKRLQVNESNRMLYDKVVSCLESLQKLDKSMQFSQHLLDVTQNEIGRYTNENQKSLAQCTHILTPINNAQDTPICLEKVKLPSKVQEATPRAVLRERFYEKLEMEELFVPHNDSSILLDNCSFLSEDIVNN